MRKEYVASGSSVDVAIDTACAMAGKPIEDLDIEVLELGGRGLFGFGHKDAKVKVSYEVPDKAPQKETRAEQVVDRTEEKESTFGHKKSKRELYEEKSKKKEKQNIEIKPIVIAEPLPERKTQAAGEEKRPQKGGENEWDRRRPDRPRNERPERTEFRDGPRGEEKPRRESHVQLVIEGEMADVLSAEAMNFLQPIFLKLKVEPVVNMSVREGILWLSFAGQNLGLLIGRRGETLNSLQYLTNLAVNKRRHEHVRIVLDVEGYRDSREETLAALARKMADKAVKSGRRVELEPMNPHERRVVHLALQNDRRVDTISHGEEPYRRVVISKKRNDRKPRYRGEKKQCAPQQQVPTHEQAPQPAPSVAETPQS